MTKITTNERYQQDEVLSAVLAADSVLLFSHIFPDGDTLGSALAMKLRLERLGKRVQLMMDGVVPSYLAFLPGADTIIGPQSEVKPYDLALPIDVASPDRLGQCMAIFEKAQKTAVIDHHGTNSGYALCNMIDEAAPAAALLIYRLFAKMDLPLSTDEAICLYTALSTDTGNFIYDSTNAECFAMMSGLMEAGLPLAEYSRRLFRQKELPFVRLLAEVLPTLRMTCNGKVAGLALSLAHMERAGANNGHTEGIVNYAIDLEGVGAAYLAKELADGKTKISLRALPPCAVDGIAARFGGGGHKLAAGLTLDMPLAQAVQTIEQALSEAIV